MKEALLQCHPSSTTKGIGDAIERLYQLLSEDIHHPKLTNSERKILEIPFDSRMTDQQQRIVLTIANIGLGRNVAFV